MSSTGVRDSNSDGKRTIKGLIKNEEAFVQSLRVFANTSTLSGLGSTGGEITNAPLGASGSYFRKSGDTMIGQSGENFGVTSIIDGKINVSKSDGTTDALILLFSQLPEPDTLDTIIEGSDVYSFQRLRLRTVLEEITITENDNIITPQGGDLIVQPDSIITLVFDTAVVDKWRIESITNGMSDPIRTVFIAPTTKGEADIAFGKTIGQTGIYDSGSTLTLFVKQQNGNWASSNFTYDSLT